MVPPQADPGFPRGWRATFTAWPHVPPAHSWKPITDYVDQQFEQYFRDESGLNRKNIQDNRVHCCLYFISPFGHGCVTVLGPGATHLYKAPPITP